MKNDSLEKAIKSAYIGCNTPSYEHLTGTKDYKHLACIHCGHHRAEKVTLENGEVVFKCKKCGLLSDRLKLVKTLPSRTPETRGRIIRDILAANDVDFNAIKRLSTESRAWLEWAHTSKFSGDREKSDRAAYRLRWSLYCRALPASKPQKKEDPVVFIPRLFSLCEIVVRGKRAGVKMPNSSDIAKMLFIDKSAFSDGRRWPRVLNNCYSVIDAWENEIIHVMDE